MQIPRWSVLAGLATALWAQGTNETALARLNARVDIQSATVSLRKLRNTTKVSDAGRPAAGGGRVRRRCRPLVAFG